MNNLNSRKRVRKTVVKVVWSNFIPHKSKDYPRLLQGPATITDSVPERKRGSPAS